MESHSIATRWSDCVKGAASLIRFRGTFERVKPRRHSYSSSRVERLALLLLGLLAGCAVRAPHPDRMETQISLPERTVTHLITVWERNLSRYISQEGGGDPAVLSQTRALHSRDILRPARITFAVLDVDAQVPRRDGWDVEGVLIGKQSGGAQNWYVFLVGIVARSGYRPSSIEDIRVVRFSAQGEQLAWVMGPPDRKAMRLYWETFHRSAAIRFPGETDEFVMKVEEDGAWVQEIRSGAHWSLRPSDGNSVANGS